MQVRDLKQKFSTLLDPKALTPEERLIHARMLFQGPNHQLAVDMKLMPQLLEALETDEPEPRGWLPVMRALMGYLIDQTGKGAEYGQQAETSNPMHLM